MFAVNKNKTLLHQQKILGTKYLLKVNENTRARCEIWSKLTIKNDKNDVHGVVLMFLLLTLSWFYILHCYFVNFQRVNKFRYVLMSRAILNVVAVQKQPLGINHLEFWLIHV